MNILNWVSDLSELSVAPTASIQAWLTKPYIVSEALRKFYPDLNVKVIGQCFMPAFEDENAILHLSAVSPLVRQVFLQGNDIALTYGRVVIPRHTFDKHFKDTSLLGSNFFGEKFLYNNPAVRRGPFEFAQVDNHHPIAKEVSAQLRSYSTATLFARRSLFWMHEDPLLVMEIFLPSLPSYPE